MNKIGVGIIGTGSIADLSHAPAINVVTNAELVGVLSRNHQRGVDFLQKHEALSGKSYSSLKDFVADTRINLVLVCSPDGRHAEQAKACLNAGKHVLIEKPMTLTAEEADELVSLAETNNLVLATGFHLRSHAGHKILHEKVRKEGIVGNVRHIRAVWAFPFQDDSNWRANDELTKWWSLSAVGSHCIDLSRWFADDFDDWQEFKVTIANNIWQGYHDETAVIAAQTKKGPTVEVVSSVQFGPFNRLEIFGDRGSAICESTMGRDGKGEIQINGEKLEFEAISPFVNQLNDLLDCIETGKNPDADGKAGVRSVRDLLLTL